MNIITKTPKTIAIVGNGPTASEYSQEIDSHDLVVRISQAPFCGIAGQRTDVLAIINWSNPGHTMTSGTTPINALALDMAEVIWLPMPPEEMESTKADQLSPPPWPAYADFTQEVISKLAKGRPCVRFPPRIWRDLKQELRALGALKEHAASTGALVLAYAVQAYPKSNIRLFGFTHEGWGGHPWDAERKWVKGLTAVSYGDVH